MKKIVLGMFLIFSFSFGNDTNLIIEKLNKEIYELKKEIQDIKFKQEMDIGMIRENHKAIMNLFKFSVETTEEKNRLTKNQESFKKAIDTLFKFAKEQKKNNKY